MLSVVGLCNLHYKLVLSKHSDTLIDYIWFQYSFSAVLIHKYRGNKTSVGVFTNLLFRSKHTS